MYKDGFELVDGNYYWARWSDNTSDVIFVVQFCSVAAGFWDLFHLTGGDVARDYEIELLKEIKYDN